MNAEELTSDESVSEDADTTEEVSEETEDVEPLEILYENGTTVLEDEATEEWALSYDDVTLTYDSFAEVSKAIDDLDNPEGVYTIYCTKSESGYDAYFKNAFPTVAAELIFEPMTSNQNGPYIAWGPIETDIKITLHAPLMLGGNDNIKEVVIDGSTFYPDRDSYIETVTMTNGSTIYAAEPVEIGTCNIDESSGMQLSWTGVLDDETGEYVYTGEGFFDIDNLNLSGDTFKFKANDMYDTYSIGDVALTTKTEITDANLVQDSQNSFMGKVVSNEDGTYSIVLEENTTYCYSLAYGNTVEEYLTYDDVVERIEERNSTSTTYTIQLTEAGMEKTDGFVNIYSLPTKAAKVVFQAPQYNSDQYIYTCIAFNTIDSGCPIEVKGWENASFNKSSYFLRKSLLF